MMDVSAMATGEDIYLPHLPISQFNTDCTVCSNLDWLAQVTETLAESTRKEKSWQQLVLTQSLKHQLREDVVTPANQKMYSVSPALIIYICIKAHLYSDKDIYH